MKTGIIYLELKLLSIYLGILFEIHSKEYADVIQSADLQIAMEYFNGIKNLL